jgi:hypothetical protein
LLSQSPLYLPLCRVPSLHSVTRFAILSPIASSHPTAPAPATFPLSAACRRSTRLTARSVRHSSALAALSSAGADVVDSARYGIEAFVASTHMPWWLAIVSGTIALRYARREVSSASWRVPLKEGLDEEWTLSGRMRWPETLRGSSDHVPPLNLI